MISILQVIVFESGPIKIGEANFVSERKKGLKKIKKIKDNRKRETWRWRTLEESLATLLRFLV